MTGLQVTGHFHRYGHVGSTEMGGAKHFERPCCLITLARRARVFALTSLVSTVAVVHYYSVHCSVFVLYDVYHTNCSRFVRALTSVLVAKMIFSGSSFHFSNQTGLSSFTEILY
jgi:hypothetical protein